MFIYIDVVLWFIVENCRESTSSSNNRIQEVLNKTEVRAFSTPAYNLSAACSSVLLLTSDGGATALTLAVGAGDDDEVTTSADIEKLVAATVAKTLPLALSSVLAAGGLKSLGIIIPTQSIEPAATDQVQTQPGPSREDRFYTTESKVELSDDLRELTTQGFSKSLSKKTWQGLLENYPPLEGTESILHVPTMEAGMREEIRKMHGYLKTKDVFAFDDALAEKQGAFLLTARPIIAALIALDHLSEEEEGPDPDLVKGMLEDALVLLGNANVRLNSWRQRRFSEYLTEVGKRTLKEEIPSDQHLFPDRFHDRIKDEHNHTATNKSMISKPHDKALSSARFIPSRQPFRGRSAATSRGNGSRKR
ncbi:Hypothetical predicted protein, partial [Paramuricea clavata]